MTPGAPAALPAWVAAALGPRTPAAPPDSLLAASPKFRDGLQQLRRMGLSDGLEHQLLLYHTPKDQGDSDYVSILPDRNPSPSSVTPYTPTGLYPIARAHDHPWSGYNIPAQLFPTTPDGGYEVPGPSPNDRKIATQEGFPEYVVDGSDKGNVWRADPNTGAVNHWDVASLLGKLGFTTPTMDSAPLAAGLSGNVPRAPGLFADAAGR